MIFFNLWALGARRSPPGHPPPGAPQNGVLGLLEGRLKGYLKGSGGPPPSMIIDAIPFHKKGSMSLHLTFGHPQRLLIFHLILGRRSESFLGKPVCPYYGSESPGGSSFCLQQVLLSKNFRPRLGSRQKFLLRTTGVGA